MRFLATLLVALIVSILVGGVFAVLLADWLRGDETFILIFVAIGPVALVSLIVFLIAGTRPEPRRAIGRAARTLVILLVLAAMALAILEFLTAPTDGLGIQGMELIGAMFACCALVVITQWIVFRLGARGPGTVTSTPQFGRPPQT